MALVKMDESGRCWNVTEVPYKKDYQALVAKLKAPDLDAIRNKLYGFVEETLNNGDRIFVSSWIPGDDWSKEHDGVFNPIYTDACGQDVELAGKLFGLILYEVVINRSEKWMCAHIDGLARGLCYWYVD